MQEVAATIRAAAFALAALGATGVALAQAQPAATVGQKDKVFSQEQVALRAGQTVRFTNDDTVAHNVMVRDPGGATRAAVLQRPGEHTDVGFDKPGEYDVRCAIHPRMRMTVQAQ